MAGLDLAAGMLPLTGGAGPCEAMFKTALKSVSGSESQLILLLSAELLQKALIPFGHLAEIAERCQIRIDLGAELPPGFPTGVLLWLCSRQCDGGLLRTGADAAVQ